MMLGPAERLVKHSSLQAWGEGRMVSVSPGPKFASQPNIAPRSRSRSGMTLDGSITDTGLSDAAQVCGSPSIVAGRSCPSTFTSSCAFAFGNGNALHVEFGFSSTSLMQSRR